MKQTRLILLAVQLLHVTFSEGLQCFSCENEPSIFLCIFRGQLQTCSSNQESCLTVVRRCGTKLAFWKGCKQTAACLTSARSQVTPTANGLLECNSDQENSVCTCCCEDERCNLNSRPCFGMTFDCEDRGQTEDGSTVCNDGNLSGSVCRHACDDPDILPFPSGDSVCQRNGAWNQPLPSCVLIDCEDRGQTINGSTVCNDGNRPGSICNHTCSDPDVTPFPSGESICLRTGEWDQPLPTCIMECENRGSIVNGSTTCTEGNRVGSVCTHTCNDAALQPSESQSVCQFDGEWLRPLPCCARPCPPFAVADVVLMKQANSNESFQSFINRSLLLSESFTLSDDDLFLGVLSYTSSVNVDDSIFLSQDAARQNQASLDALRGLRPRAGVNNIQTGEALTFVFEQYFTVDAGDRPNVQNIIVLEMDSVSSDNVAAVAMELRQQGVLILAIASRANTDPLYMQQLIEITGREEQVYIESGPADYLNALSADFCVAQCSSLSQI